MKIGVFGHVGNQNLGDEALVAAVLQNLRRRCPDTELCGFTGRPADTSQRHHIVTFPIRRGTAQGPGPRTQDPTTDTPSPSGWRVLADQWPRLAAMVRAPLRCTRAVLAVPQELIFLARSYRRLHGVDLLVVAGSAQLNDYWGGPWGFPFTLWKWSLLARLRGTKVVLLSVGAGPIRTALGRFFLRQTVRLAQDSSYRDEDSRRCVLRLGIGGEHRVTPDLVFGLDLAPRIAVREKCRVVGINPMPVGDDDYWPEQDPAGYRHYLDVIASGADWLDDRGYRVRFFPTQLLVDGRVIEEVRRRMKSGSEVAPVGSIDDLVKVIDGLDLAIATRYHATVFSLIRCRPVMSVAYQVKSIEVMRQAGLEEYAVAIARLTLPELQHRVIALEQNRQTILETIARRLPAMREALDTQYDRVLALSSAAPAQSRARQVFNDGSTPVSPALRLSPGDIEKTA